MNFSKMSRFSKLSLALASIGVVSMLTGCGGGSGSGTSTTPYDPYSPTVDVRCTPGNDVIGTWKVVANNKTLMPDSPQLPFFSYNQPSVNNDGVVVFRGRAKSGTSGSGEIQRGIYATEACKPISIYTVADTVNTPVPAPNNTSATFNEFPSIPRIDAHSGLIATRGQSAPVWTYTDPVTGLDTKAGTSGVYVTSPSGLSTGMGILGNVPEFSYMQVPGASTTGLKFDQFPGSPSVTDSKYLVFKGNYTETNGTLTTSKTGVYYRDLTIAGSPTTMIASSNTVIPGQTTTSTTFDSTAPPSSADGKVVFLGLDNELTPTMGGIYMAPIADKPTLDPLVQIGQVVPNKAGTALDGTSKFTQIGEGLSFDGRYVAFWGAWGQDFATHGGMHTIQLTCPTDGSKALQAACMAGSDKDASGNPTGQTTEYVPDNQGIFLVDSQTKGIWMVARGEDPAAGPLGSIPFQGFMYWNYSGSTQGGDAEPPKWRSSAFAAVDGNRGVIFKGSPTADSVSGIYGVPFNKATGTLGTVFKVIATGDQMTTLDAAAPAGPITSVSIEREGLRAGWLTLTASSADWAGAYVTYFPGAFHLAGTPDANGIDNLILGN